jgi:hypothetical protein
MGKRNLQWVEDLLKKGDAKGAALALQDISTNGVIFEFRYGRACEAN